MSDRPQLGLMETSMKKKRGLMEVVPEEIMEEILYKLPPKSLLRFKSVAKSWRCRISSPRFIKNHLNQSRSHHQNLILCLDECVKSYPLESGVLDCVPPRVLDYPIIHPSYAPLSIDGSCNGLVLAVSEFDGFVILWNPSTSKARDILPPIRQRCLTTEPPVYGLGYDASTDDYRIVCIYPSGPVESPTPYKTEIYSLRTDSWKKADDFVAFPAENGDSGKFLEGRLHWIAEYVKYDGKGKYMWDIVSLDLNKGRYEVVAKPQCLPQLGCFPHSLRVLGGNLCLAFFISWKRDMNVWVMKEYGVRESWVQVLNVLSPTDLTRMIVERPRQWTRGVYKPGDRVLAFGSKLIFCDGQNNLHSIEADVVRKSIDANVYVETLVSPFGDADDDQPPNLPALAYLLQN